MLCPLLTVMSCRDNTATSNETAPSVSADANLNSMEAALEKELYASNAQMPMQVDYATTLNSVTRDGKVVTYEYVIDEGVFKTLGINLTCEANYESKKLYHNHR